MKMRRRKRHHRIRWVTFTQLIREAFRKPRVQRAIAASLTKSNALYRRLVNAQEPC